MVDELGKRIRAARERKGLRQDEVAESLSVDRKTIGNWERGATVPRNALARLMDLLEISDEETVGPEAESGVRLNLPDEALSGFSPAEVDEVVTAARLSALAKAREIRANQ